MKTIQYKTVDKSNWGQGPWQNEPDKVQWLDKATGLPCLIVRQPMSGHFCGYVGVPKGHPAFGKDDTDVSVHGGQNFSSKCQPHDRKQFEKWRAMMLNQKKDLAKYPRGDAAWYWRTYGHLFDDFEAWQKHQIASTVCHTVSPDEDDCVWWLGFDCAHSGDVTPGLNAMLRDLPRMPKLSFRRHDTYKTITYVRKQVRELARQLKEMAA